LAAISSSPACSNRLHSNSDNQSPGQALRLAEVVQAQLPEQAIKLLQLSRMELMDLIRQRKRKIRFSTKRSIPSEKRSLWSLPTRAYPRDSGKATEDEGEMDLPPLDWRRERTGGARKTPGRTTTPDLRNFLTKKATLSDHLLWQLRLNDFSEAECLAGLWLSGI